MNDYWPTFYLLAAAALGWLLMEVTERRHDHRTDPERTISRLATQMTDDEIWAAIGQPNDQHRSGT